MANIAEGYERCGDKEFIRFLNISKGSLAEVKSHLFVAFDVGYISNEILKRFIETINKIGRLISRLIKYLKTD